MHFGIRNVAQSFQRFMDNNLRDSYFCFAYLDDILLYSIELYRRLLPLAANRGTVARRPRRPLGRGFAPYHLDTGTRYSLRQVQRKSLTRRNFGTSRLLSTTRLGFRRLNVLQQRVKNARQPLAFFSRKLSPGEQKYSA